MNLVLVVTFFIGVALGTLLGVIGLSLCLIGKRSEALVETSRSPTDTLVPHINVRTGTTM